MHSHAIFALRLGLGITFIWIGTLIMQDPAGWAGLIRSDIAAFMPGDPAVTMRITGAFDIVLGLVLAFGLWPWIAGLLGALHLLVVIATIYIGDSTARDVGLLGACIALMFSSPMPGFVQKLLGKS